MMPTRTRNEDTLLVHVGAKIAFASTIARIHCEFEMLRSNALQEITAVHSVYKKIKVLFFSVKFETLIGNRVENQNLDLSF